MARVAAGGMGEVFLGRAAGPAGFERRVAVKRVIALEGADRERLESLLAREARLAVRLDHPNVVRILDLVREGDSFYLVMEWVPGVDLRRLRDLVRRPLTPIEVVGIAIQLLEGLRAAHSLRDPETGLPSPIVHCDVSPQNVLLSASGLVKLSDFGVARASQDSVHLSGAGKVRYMAPEAMEGGPVDARSDLYSAAVVIHELLSGVSLFEGIDTEKALAAKRSGAPHVRDSRPEAPAALDAVLARALDPDPARRYPSADALSIALREALGAAREDLDRAVAGLVATIELPTPSDRISSPDLTVTLPASLSIVGSPLRTPSAETVPARPAPPRRGRVLGAALVAAIVLLAGTYALVTRAPPPRRPAAREEAWRSYLPTVPRAKGIRLAIAPLETGGGGPEEQYLADLLPRYLAERLDRAHGIETLHLFASAEDLVRPLETAPTASIASALGATRLLSSRLSSGRTARVRFTLAELPSRRVLATTEIDARPAKVLGALDAWLDARPAGIRPAPPRRDLASRDAVLLSRWHRATELLQRQLFDEALTALQRIARSAPDEDAVWVALAIAVWWHKSGHDASDPVLQHLEATAATAPLALAVRRLLAEDPCGALEALGPAPPRPGTVWTEYLRAESEFHCGRFDEANRRFVRIFDVAPEFLLAMHHPLRRAEIQRDGPELERLMQEMRMHDAFSDEADQVEFGARVAVRRYDEAIAVAESGARRLTRPTALPLQIAWAEMLAGRPERARGRISSIASGATLRVTDAADLSMMTLAEDLQNIWGFPIPEAVRAATNETAWAGPPSIWVERYVAEERIRSFLLGVPTKRPLRQVAPIEPAPQRIRRARALAGLLVPEEPRPDAASLAGEPDLAALAASQDALARGDARAAAEAARRAQALEPEGRYWPIHVRALVLALRSAHDEAGARAACDDLLHPPVHSPLWSAAAKVCRPTSSP